MSYATLHDTNGRHIYDHVTDNLYDSPYGENLAENVAYGRRSDTDSAYEPEPTGPNAVVTINGVAVRWYNVVTNCVVLFKFDSDHYKCLVDVQVNFL